MKTQTVYFSSCTRFYSCEENITLSLSTYEHLGQVRKTFGALSLEAQVLLQATSGCNNLYHMSKELRLNP